MGEMNMPADSKALDTGTTLAYERTRIAYERTMMAWIRTATSLITFGFSVYKFFEIEIDMKGGPIVAMLLGPRGFGLALIVIGLLALVLGVLEHVRDLRRLRIGYTTMPRSMSAIIALAIGLLGVAALLAVIARA